MSTLKTGRETPKHFAQFNEYIPEPVKKTLDLSLHIAVCTDKRVKENDSEDAMTCLSDVGKTWTPLEKYN